MRPLPQSGRGGPSWQGTPRLAPISIAGANGKLYHSVRGKVGVFLCGAGGPLVAREIYPDPIPDGKVRDPFPMESMTPAPSWLGVTRGTAALHRR